MFKFVSSDGNLFVIDLALTVFLYHGNSYERKPVLDQHILLESFYINDVKEAINEIQEENSDAMIGINVEFIHATASSRAFVGFADAICNSANVFFFGVEPDTEFQAKLCSDLAAGGKRILYDREHKIVFLGSLMESQSHSILEKCQDAVDTYMADVVKGITAYKDEPELLSSSNVYVDCYVNLKGLFMEPEKLRVVVYHMAKEIINKGLSYDALVCSSKNGAVLATLIGQIIDKRVIYCVNVGPQYALLPQIADEAFRAGGKYVYIGDFICLGTEVKVLHALMCSRQSSLVAGVGVASYIPIGTPDLRAKHSPLAMVHCLVNLIDAGIPYRIAVRREDFTE